VAIQPTIRVIDVTHNTHGQVEAQENEEGTQTKIDKKVLSNKENDQKNSLVALPKNLLQFDIRIPTEEKDLYTYYYLLKVS
jgi:hypothetical protein